jgi:TolA-binding protein
VLFWYANALVAHGRAGDAIAVLDELIADHPASKHRADAFLTLGDTRFDRGDIAGALASYQGAG